MEYAFSTLKVAAILVFILLGGWIVAGSGFSNLTVHGGFFPKGAWGMWVAVIVSIFSYLSIEMIAVAAGEAEDPQRANAESVLASRYLGTLRDDEAVPPRPALRNTQEVG